MNGIATVKGGTHVNCVTEQIEDYVVEKVHQMKKDVDKIQPHAVKNHLWIFVKALAFFFFGWRMLQGIC